MQSTIDRSQADRTRWFADAARAVLARRRVPRATYRLQFNPDFTFQDARRAVPYLDALGVSDVYASPLLKPCAGSTHGYDICDHHQLNPALGSLDDFHALTTELQKRGMGLIFDVVPNHMGITDSCNAWWMDVLEDGPSSPYASFFDIDWHPMKVGADLENKVLLPILGDLYGKVLTKGELKLIYGDGAFSIAYFSRTFPVNPRSYADLLTYRLEDVIAALGEDDPDVLELQSIITAIRHLPNETETDAERVAERQREKAVIKRRVEQLAARCPVIQQAIEDTVRAFNGKPGDVRSFDLLDDLLSAQSYRLAFWRVAAEEINYRRFFDINDLAAIRMERPEVFAESHRLIMQLVAAGEVTGLRIDHADGLWDPVGYLRDLQRAAFQSLAQNWLSEHVGPEGDEREAAEADLMRHYDAEVAVTPESPIGRPMYLVVEKILGSGEALPPTWPVDGTTGYDFANQVNALFVDSRNQKAMSDVYTGFTHTHLPPFGDLVNSTKKMIMLASLPSEVNSLAFQLKRMAGQSRWYRDLTLNSLTFALREVIASLPIYRTYLTPMSGPVDEHDRAAIEAAITDARRRNPRTAAAVFDYIRAVLLEDYPEDAAEETRAEWTRFVMRFQQVTGPVVAKGIEDTAFYVYNRLLSLNEVGGNPERFGLAPANFHQINLQRREHWPHAMLAGSTHDSKRSVDVRARLDVLSEIPRVFQRGLSQWGRQNRAKKTLVQGALAPDRNDEYLLYQTLLGAWPLEDLDRGGLEGFRDRVQAYMEKAIKEAKIHTSWVNPNAAYDDATSAFVASVLTGPKSEAFRASFRPIQRMVAFYGMLNSLSLHLLQLTAPGVPDIYQGNEIWDFSLVDPDNRRPVDYAVRDQYLRSLEAASQSGITQTHATAVAASGVARAETPGAAAQAPGPAGFEALATELLAHWEDGRVKLHVIRQALAARRAHPEVFASGSYEPLQVVGAAREHAVSFARRDGNHAILTVLPRLVATLTREEQKLPLGAAVWGDTAVVLPEDLAGTDWRNRFTGEAVVPETVGGRPVLPLAQVFTSFPAALIENR